LTGRTLNGPQERAAEIYEHAAIAHERAESAEAGLTVLNEGGNAVDVAVAVGFAACVVMPAWTTIAGSGFMLIRPDECQPPVAIEFPPRAPLGASPDMYELEADDDRTAIIGVSSVVDDANVKGAKAVGVPGVVAGLCEAHARFGRLPLETVIAPSIELAHEGFAVEPELQMQTIEVQRDLREADGVRGTFLTSEGLPWTTGAGADAPARIVQPDLAAVLDTIAREGRDGFYRGAIAQEIVGEVCRRGGVLSTDDLARTEALVTTPLSIHVGNATIWAPSSPSGSWTELQILGLLARLDGILDPDRPFDLRTFIEASRRCFADRFHFMGDPEHVPVPLDALLSDGYLDGLAEEIAAAADPADWRFAYPESAPWSYYASRVPESFARIRPDLTPTPWADATRAAAGLGDSFETTHLSTIDEGGMTVSCTLTAAHTYGSRLVAAGVVLDDAMVWFNAAPGAANSIAPWKRPLVNMGPLLCGHDDGRILAVGAPGGRRVVSAVSQVAAHWLRGDALEAATARPRVDGSGGDVLVSARFEDAQVDALYQVGHAVRVVDDRDRFCIDFARPVAVASASDERREAAVQPFVRGSVAGR